MASHPEHDVTIERVIHAPRGVVWDAWTTPDLFGRWWIPEPYICTVEYFAPRAGGGFVTMMNEDGAEPTPHMDAAFLVVEKGERLVFTNAVDSTLRPATPMPVAVTGRSRSPTIRTARCTGSPRSMQMNRVWPSTRSSVSWRAGPSSPRSSRDWSSDESGQPSDGSGQRTGVSSSASTVAAACGALRRAARRRQSCEFGRRRLALVCDCWRFALIRRMRDP